MSTAPLPVWKPLPYEKPKWLAANAPDGTASSTTYALKAHDVTVLLQGCFRSETTQNLIKDSINRELQKSFSTGEVKTLRSNLENIGSPYCNLVLKTTIRALTTEELDSKYLKQKHWLDLSAHPKHYAKKIFLFTDESKNELSISVSCGKKYTRKWMDTIEKIDEHIERTGLTNSTYDEIVSSFQLIKEPIEIEYNLLLPQEEFEELEFPTSDDEGNQF